MLVELIPALKNRLTLVNSSISRDSVIDDGMLVKLERKHNYVPSINYTMHFSSHTEKENNLGENVLNKT